MKDNTIIILVVALSVIIPSLVYVTVKADTINLYLNREKLTPIGSTMVISPIMTANAYASGGFYDYYSGECNETCLTVDISQSQNLGEAGSENGARTLYRLGYGAMNDFILDYRLRTQPDFLLAYDKIIMLHSEYVTQRIYDALQRHPNVIYLYPNANYALVKVEKNHMTLVRGHGYPTPDITNGFGWEYDNSNLEYDKECSDYHWARIKNGYQLSCNPELIINKNLKLLSEIKNL